MAIKVGFVIMAPDGDPKKYRSTMKTSKTELTSVLIQLLNFDQAEEVCKELVQKQGVKELIL